MKNWKIIFPILFSTLILYNSLRVSITYIYYNLDTAGFIEAYCENKDKPALHCDGKCHLKKVIKTTDEEKNQPIQLTDFKDLLLYSEKVSSFHLTKFTDQNTSTFQYLNLYHFKLLAACFHPPNA